MIVYLILPKQVDIFWEERCKVAQNLQIDVNNNQVDLHSTHQSNTEEIINRDIVNRRVQSSPIEEIVPREIVFGKALREDHLTGISSPG